MDWQTKEYMDSRFDELETKIDLIIEHLEINQDDQDNYEDNSSDEESESEEQINL
jgi:hypothetical protein